MIDRRRLLGLSEPSRRDCPGWDDIVMEIGRMRLNRAPQSLPDTADGYPQLLLRLQYPESRCLPRLLAAARQQGMAVCLHQDGFACRLIDRAGLHLMFEGTAEGIDQLSKSVCLVWTGTPVGVLRDMGFAQFNAVPAQLSLAQWLCSPYWHDRRAGQGWRSGVQKLEVCLGSGALRLWDAHFALDSWSSLSEAERGQWRTLSEQAQELAPQCADAAVRQHCCAAEELCALEPDSAGSANMARLLAGSLGTLALPLRMVISRTTLDPRQTPSREAVQARRPSELDIELKNLLDPDGVLPYLDEWHPVAWN